MVSGSFISELLINGASLDRKYFSKRAIQSDWELHGISAKIKLLGEGLSDLKRPTF